MSPLAHCPSASNNTRNARRQPVLFVSHGAPDLLLNPGETGELWTALGHSLPRPCAILVISAHWRSHTATISTAQQPVTIHDFDGFPAALYAMQYPAPGAGKLARRVVELLTEAGIPVQQDEQRGLDHGAWVPLKCLHPAADIPVSQLSLAYPTGSTGPEFHHRLGGALRPLRDQGVLILASGAVTHNFDWLAATGSPARAEAVEFADWLRLALQQGNAKAVLNYRREAPFGAASHPTEEHLLPLFVAWGAADENDQLKHAAPEYTYGGLAMDAYLWQSAENNLQQGALSSTCPTMETLS